MPAKVPQQPLTAAFLYAVRHCLQSISSYATVPDQLGVTLIPDKSGLVVCSTNRATISYARLVPSPLALKKRVILSTDFCEQMLRLAAGARTLRLAVKRHIRTL